jgi:hypothetical protein
LQVDEAACTSNKNECVHPAPFIADAREDGMSSSVTWEPEVRQNYIPSESINITESCVKILGNLQAKSNMMQSNVETIAENLQFLLSDAAEFCNSHAKKFCQAAEVDSSSSCVNTILDSISELHNAMEPIATSYRHDQYLSRSGFFIRPIQIVLGSRTETRFSATVGFHRTSVVEDAMQYVSLSVLLASSLCNDYYASMMRDFRLSCFENDPQIMSHFFHTETHKKNQFSRNILMHLHYIFT